MAGRKLRGVDCPDEDASGEQGLDDAHVPGVLVASGLGTGGEQVCGPPCPLVTLGRSPRDVLDMLDTRTYVTAVTALAGSGAAQGW